MTSCIRVDRRIARYRALINRGAAALLMCGEFDVGQSAEAKSAYSAVDEETGCQNTLNSRIAT